MLDVEEKLRETEEGIKVFELHKVTVPDEALEIREIMERCVAAERKVALGLSTPEALASNAEFDRRAYEAYSRNTDGKSLVSGQPLPTWDDMQERIRAAWLAAAAEVCKGCMEFFQIRNR